MELNKLNNKTINTFTGKSNHNCQIEVQYSGKNSRYSRVLYQPEIFYLN